MNEFIQKLGDIPQSHFCWDPHSKTFVASHAFYDVMRVSNDASGLLMNGAYPYASVKKELTRYGYALIPGDTSPKGWLTGIIEYPDGRRLEFTVKS